MKKTILITFLLVTNLFCKPNSNMELMNNPDIIKVFSKEEISSLELIVDFFDSFILKKAKKNQDINQAYHEYFESIDRSESIEDLRIHIGLTNSDNTKELIMTLKEKGIFKEIWKYSYEYDYITKDTLSVNLAPNVQGKYMQFLELLGKHNNYISEYVNTIQSSDCIAPSLVAGFMKDFYKDVDFHKEVNRLIFAVHYITIVSEEKYNK